MEDDELEGSDITTLPHKGKPYISETRRRGLILEEEDDEQIARTVSHNVGIPATTSSDVDPKKLALSHATFEYICRFLW